MKHVWQTIGAIAVLVGIIAFYDTLATDKEVEAGLKVQTRKANQAIYDRRVEFAELRVDIHCRIVENEAECEYWRNELHQAKLKREDFQKNDK